MLNGGEEGWIESSFHLFLFVHDDDDDDDGDWHQSNSRNGHDDGG